MEALDEVAAEHAECREVVVDLHALGGNWQAMMADQLDDRPDLVAKRGRSCQAGDKGTVGFHDRGRVVDKLGHGELAIGDIDGELR